jgi:threonine/homoserine/homoserine lactone efflux protein
MTWSAVGGDGADRGHVCSNGSIDPRRRAAQAQPFRQGGGTFGRLYDRTFKSGACGDDNRRDHNDRPEHATPMSDLILRILPLAVAAAINPTGILVVVALLATAKRTALLLTAGFCAAFIAFGVVVLALGLRLELTPGPTSAAIDLVAAAAIAYLGARSLQKRKKPKDDPAKQHRHLGPAAAFGAGLALAAVDFSSIIPYLDALKDMVVAGAGSAAAWVALAVFLVICLFPMVAPVALAYIAPATAQRVLDPIRHSLQKHGQTIMAVVCFVIAAYLAVKSVRGF